MKRIKNILLCNVEESKFYPACLDCAKHPSRVHRCLENIEKELGIRCCGLCEHWVDPKPTADEKLIGVCARKLGGHSCFCEGCEEFEKRGPSELDTENFDLSGLNDLVHYPKFDEDDE